MRHFPIFADLNDRKVVLSGANSITEAKLRLLMKTGANIFVYGTSPSANVKNWAQAGKISLFSRAISADDTHGALLVYAANGNAELNSKTVEYGRASGAMVNVVDNLEASDFITPAIVDRSPVTVAISTEGTAPVLARKIKSDVETALPANLGLLARIAESFRPKLNSIEDGRIRRKFWNRFFFGNGTLTRAKDAVSELDKLLVHTLSEAPDEGRVSFLGAGPGDPHLLTVKASAYLQNADVVVHDRQISSEILDVARREAIIIENGPGTLQMIIEHTKQGAHIVRLKAGEPSIFGRIGEEIKALDQAGVSYEIVPGISDASVASALMLEKHPVNGTSQVDIPLKLAGE
ncbi:MAG: SAM-dependent methyltransferase [Rhizobiaceae bacterium]